VLVALGEPLSFTQEDVALRGHAIECRINAEDASRGFLPTPARITAYREPAGPGVRVDSGVEEGREVVAAYDPMISKLIVHGVDREHARRRMLRALGEYVIDGPTTLIPFHTALLSHECFVRAETCAGIVESLEIDTNGRVPRPVTLPGRTIEDVRVVEVDGRRFQVRVTEPEAPWLELARRRRERVSAGAAGGTDVVVSPMQGTVLSVAVSEGDEVEAGALVCIVEAMKMENEVHAHRAGTVSELSVAAGQPVATGQVICLISSA
jgi:acetyl-CoA/propionyl-CoA carboxylase biotin carboxyl carrier protein